MRLHWAGRERGTQSRLLKFCHYTHSRLTNTYLHVGFVYVSVLPTYQTKWFFTYITLRQTWNDSTQVKVVSFWRAGVLTAVAEVVRVHERDGHRLLRVQSALVGITAIHGVHHVRHLLTGVSDGILALLGELPDDPITERIIKDLLLWKTASFHPSPTHNKQNTGEREGDDPIGKL